MANSGQSRAKANGEIRRKELVEKLKAGGHIQHVIEIAEKLMDLNQELEPAEIQRLKAAADIKKGLISKYLPDVKQTELIGDEGNPIEIDQSIQVELIGESEAS